MKTPTGFKVRYLDLYGSTLQDTLAVPPSGYGLGFTSLPYWACPNSPSQSKLTVTFSSLLPILPCQHAHSWQCRESKGNYKVEYYLLVMGGLVIFFVSTLLILYEIGNFAILVTPISCDLTKFWFPPFWLLTLLPLLNGSPQTSVKLPSPEEAQKFERSTSTPSSILAWNVELGCLEFLDCRSIWDILEAVFLWSRFPYQ